MLTFDIVGSGRPVVVLHGAFSDRRIFGYQLVGLAPEACAVAIDLPGFGGSSWDRSTSWHEAAVDGVLDVVRSLGDAPVVVGCSEAASVAREVVLRLAAARLVLVAAGDTDAKGAQSLVKDYPRAARAHVRAATSTPVSPETEEWMFAMATGSSLDAQLAALGETVGSEPLPPETVTLTGDLDQVLTPDTRIRAAHDISLPCGHMPHVELADRFTSLVLGFAKGGQ